MGQFKLYLFGAPRVEVNGKPIELNLRKGAALFVYIAVTRQPYPRDALATLLWPEKDQQTARANLRRTLYELSLLLGEQLFEVTTEKVALRANAPLWLDIDQYQTYVAGSLTIQPSMQALDTHHILPLVEAANLYAADFMSGFTLPDCPEFDDWQFFSTRHVAQFLCNLDATTCAHIRSAGHLGGGDTLLSSLACARPSRRDSSSSTDATLCPGWTCRGGTMTI